MTKLVELDEFHKHEALHTTYLVMEMFNEYVLSHPAISQHYLLREDAEDVSKTLFDFYQAIGKEYE